jgi:hypothetical protein
MKSKSKKDKKTKWRGESDANVFARVASREVRTLREATTIRAEFSAREWDTVLAALRLWQTESAHIADGAGFIASIAEEHGDPLTNAEVDRLIERIN